MNTRAEELSAVAEAGRFVQALVQLTKPGITRIVVLTTALGAVMAPGAPNWVTLALTVFGTVLVVGSANALNMCLEVDIDARMSRTRTRPLPEGRISLEAALGFGLLLAVGGVAVLGLAVNPLAGELAVLALISYVLIYTPMKGVSSVALYLGAVPGALPPLLGYAGVHGVLTIEAWSVFAILFVWQVPHFLAITVFRVEEYRRAGLRVMPIEKGMLSTIRAIKWGAVALVATTFLPTLLGMGGISYLTIASLSGAAFLFLAFSKTRQEKDLNGWAKRVFFASLPHLVLLFAALAITAP